jgi:SH3 domain-containing protein
MPPVATERTPRLFDRAQLLPALLPTVLVLLGSSCAMHAGKRPSTQAEKQPVKETAPAKQPERQPDAAAPPPDPAVSQLREENERQRWQLLEEEAMIRQLEQRLQSQQRALDDAVQEVVRVKAKQGSLETRAQAASEMAEAEIAVKSLRSKTAKTPLPELAKAEQELTLATTEFQAQNFSGALYLVNQAKGQIRVATLRLGERDETRGLEGEIPFAAPLPLVVKSKSNVREGPGLDFQVVGSLDAGTAIKCYSAKGLWLRVDSKGGQSGWIHRSLVNTN